MASPCCQKVLLLEKQVWGWGFHLELIRIPRGKSIVICPTPPHPSARQVAGEPPAMALAPAPGASSSLPGSSPLPGEPKVALRSTPPHAFNSAFPCLSAWGKQGQGRGHLKVENGGLFLGQRIWGGRLSPLIQRNPPPNLHPHPRDSQSFA